MTTQTDNFTVITKSVADIESKEVVWLWPNRIPIEGATLIIGDPEAGKSFSTYDLIARLTTGRELPDGAPPIEPIDVLIVFERNKSSVKRRFESAEADTSRIHYIDSIEYIKDGKTQSARVNLSQLPVIESAIEKHRPKLVLFDPLILMLAGMKMNPNMSKEVREVLDPMMGLAEKYKFAFVATMHLKKHFGSDDLKLLYQASGSMDFVAIADAVFAVLPDPETNNGRLLLPVKGSDFDKTKVPSLRFEIHETAPKVVQVKWTGTSSLGEADLAGSKPRDFTKSQTCQVYLRGLLANGPMPVKWVEEECTRQGYSASTQDRARKDLGVVSIPPENPGPGAIYRIALSDRLESRLDAPPTQGVVPQLNLSEAKLTELLEKVVKRCLNHHSAEAPLDSSGVSVESDMGLDIEPLAKRLLAVLNDQPRTPGNPGTRTH